MIKSQTPIKTVGTALVVWLALLAGAHADNPITRGTPLQMTNIILSLARGVAGIDFGDGVVTQLNTGYGLVGGPITNGGTIAVNSNVIGTVVRVDAGAGLLGGPITRSGTLSLDTNNYVPWIEAGTNIVVLRSGRTNTVHGTIYGLPQTNIFWSVVSNHASAVYFPQDNGPDTDTNGLLVSYTPPVEGFYRIEFAELFNNTNTGTTAFDGHYIAGIKWTDPLGIVHAQRLFDMPQNTTVSDFNFGQIGSESFWYGGTFYLQSAANQAITITNRVIISWSPGDFNGWNHFNATLSTPKTNIFLGL